MNLPATKVDQACLACEHTGLHLGAYGPHASVVALLDPLFGFWPWSKSFRTRVLVCPRCGHVEQQLTPEALVKLQAKLAGK